MSEQQQKKTRGLGAMSPERAREIQAMGGSAVPREKRPFVADPKLSARARANVKNPVYPCSFREPAVRERARRTKGLKKAERLQERAYEKFDRLQQQTDEAHAAWRQAVDHALALEARP